MDCSRLKNSRKPGEDLGEGFAAVDWSKTYAYAVGLGGIYLNFKGRESGGILEEGSEAERVRKAIQTGLADFPDAHTQQPCIRNVSRREELYSGAFVGEFPGPAGKFSSWIPGFLAERGGRLFAFPAGRQYAPLERGPHCGPGIGSRHPVHESRERCAISRELSIWRPLSCIYLGVAVPESVEGGSLI